MYAVNGEFEKVLSATVFDNTRNIFRVHLRYVCSFVWYLHSFCVTIVWEHWPDTPE